jgi:hypothetical protein
MTRRTASTRTRFATFAAFAPALLLATLLPLAACDGDDFFYDDDPIASGHWADEFVDDPGAGGHVVLDFDGILEPGDYSDDDVEIEIFLDSGREAVSFELSDRAGWSHDERLGTLTFRAEYHRSADRVTVDARLDALDDTPREMEARVRYRVRTFGSTRFDREYRWRETVEF